ncbi:MAG: magnesium transporter [Pseudomonadota bacterium]
MPVQDHSDISLGESDETTVPPPVRDEDDTFLPGFLETVRDAIAIEDRAGLAETLEPLEEADVGELVNLLTPSEATQLVVLLGERFDFTVLTEVDDTVRERILADLPAEAVAEGVRDIDSDDAVYILEDLDDEDQEAILARLPEFERLKLERSLDYPEDSAGRLMQTEFIAVPPFWTVGQTIDYMRVSDDLPNSFYELFVVDPTYHLLGIVPLDTLLRTRRPVRIEDIMAPSYHDVAATDDQEDVAREFDRYNLVSAAVLDENERLVGCIMIDDVVDVIQEEAEEDIRRLSGVGDEEISDSVIYTTRSRFLWLVINLCTAVLASAVIGLFDATIEQMVALAVLMPIVASMGGNAGTQTMTVAVRGLATRELGVYNAGRIVTRELLVGLLNGVLFAVIVSIVAIVWFQSFGLALVIALAMIVNMICAGLAGILIPLLLDRIGVDPAIASSVFLTTVTDVVGFFAFLGLAAALLL